MIKASQIRAARALLNLSREELSKLSGISAATIHNIENELHATSAATLDKVVASFEKAGIAFIGQSGVELKAEIIKLFYGEAGLQDFLNDVYKTINTQEKQILRVTGVDESKFMSSLSKDFTGHHIQRMLALKNVEVRVLTNSKYDHIRLQYVSYKLMPEPHFA
jgi:transcriptional regulator with XRE-family HTH domain